MAGVALCLLTLAVLGASAPIPKRVLILDPFGRDVAPFSDTISAFRTTLARELGEPVEFYEVPLDLARFAEPSVRRAVLEAGADAFVLKRSLATELLPAIDTLLNATPPLKKQEPKS